ncbi:hypothetical protein GCM10009806_16890 [Microbacterium flavum]
MRTTACAPVIEGDAADVPRAGGRGTAAAVSSDMWETSVIVDAKKKRA